MTPGSSGERHPTPPRWRRGGSIHDLPEIDARNQEDSLAQQLPPRGRQLVIGFCMQGMRVTPGDEALTILRRGIVRL